MEIGHFYIEPFTREKYVPLAMTVTSVQSFLRYFDPDVADKQHPENNNNCVGAVAEERILSETGDTALPLFQNATAALTESNVPAEITKPLLPEGLFSRSPEAGAPILQRYLDALPADERYDAFAPLVRAHWKWMCKAAPYLKFPEPLPILEGHQINIGIRIQKMRDGGTERVSLEKGCRDGYRRIEKLVAENSSPAPVPSFELWEVNEGDNGNLSHA
jgi:hypothetical protein